MRFSEIVCELRAKKSLSREKLAKKIGVFPDVIAAWEEGTSTPTRSICYSWRERSRCASPIW